MMSVCDPRPGSRQTQNWCVPPRARLSLVRHGAIAYLLVVGSLLNQVEDLVGKSRIGEGESLGLWRGDG